MKLTQFSWQLLKMHNLNLLIVLLFLLCNTYVKAKTNYQKQDSLKLLSTQDYGKWQNIGYGGTITNDGNSLVYPIRRNNDENELRLHNLATGAVKILANGTNPKFSKDNKWLGYLINVPVAERKKLEKAKKPIRKKLGLVNLKSGDSIEIENVSAFRFSPNGEFVAIKKYLPKRSKQKGIDLIVRNLKTNRHFSFGNVVEYSWKNEGAMMAFIVETEGKTGNGVQLFDGENETIRLLDNKEAVYIGLSWRKKSDDLAVYRSMKNEAYQDSTYVIIAWKDLSTANTKSFTFDQTKTHAFSKDKRVVNNKPLKWSKDGSSIFLETKEWIKNKETVNTTKDKTSENIDSLLIKKNSHLYEDAPALEIWHSKDVHIIPEQKELIKRKREFSHLAVWYLKNNHFVQLGDQLVEKTRFQYDAPIALGLDATPYEFDGMFGRHNADVYAINLQNGKKQKFLKKINHLYSISPDGKTVVYLKNDHYHVYDFQSKKFSNLTKNIAASFVNKDDDHPVTQKPPYGFIGWDMSSASFFVHSKYDVWQINLEKSNTNITNGAEDKIISRYIKVDSDQEYINSKSSAYVWRFGEWTKKSGYAKVIPGKSLQTIHWEDTYVSRLIKAKDSKAIAYVAERYDNSPDYFVHKNGDSKNKQVSQTNPFQKNFLWGKAELIEYTNKKGRKLQGALFYPDDYDPAKKYPMITYIYELRSQNLHRYMVPSQRNYYNHKVFTSKGYFVLQPDIIFDAGDPGISSVSTMEIAVQAVIDKGLIDPDKVGLVGHSWGGYQSAFAVTNTNIFAAAVAGAGLTNLVSMYGMVAWAFGGTPENFHFEVSQERMMGPPWEDIDAYVRNSPVFNIDKMNTPLLFEVGDNDKNVDWRQGIEMYNAARRAGKNMVMLVYAKEGHGLKQDKNRFDYHNRILTWFGHYLKDEPAKDWILDGTPYSKQQKKLKNWKKE
ncbi:MAG: prolyl oligopeptidase family serine peptidase [Cellulophaga sp.]